MYQDRERLVYKNVSNLYHRFPMNIINVRKLMTIDVHKPNLHFGIAELSVFSDDDRITMFGSKSDTAP